MIPFLRSLLHLGQHLRASGLVSDSTISVVSDYLLVETTDAELRFATIKDIPLAIPVLAQKGSGRNCNEFLENLKFVFGAREDVRGAFKDSCLTALIQAGETEAHAAVVAMLERVDRCKIAAVAQKGKETYYCISSSTGETLLDRVSESVLIIPTFRGTPLCHLPGVLARAKARTEVPAVTTATDILTGEPCVPARLHARIRVLDTPVLAFNSGSFEFDGCSQGNNFTVAEETQRTYTTALEWVLASHQTATLADGQSGVSSLHVCWWTEDTTTHPIMPLLTAILRPAKREALDAAWAALAVLETDDHIVKFAGFSKAKSRFALLDTWEVPVKGLQAALLLFHSEWGHMYDNVPFLLTKSLSGTGSPIPRTALISVFRSITTGTPYPIAVLVAQRTLPRSVWSAAYMSRQYGVPMASRDTVAARYTEASPVPTIDTFVVVDPGGLSAEQMMAYQYGVFLAFFAKIRALYHTKNQVFSRKFTGGVLRQYRRPERFFRQEAQNLEMYRAWCDDHLGGVVSRTCSTHILAYWACILPGKMRRVSTATNTGFSALGWGHAWCYLAELSSYSTQIGNIKKETRRLTEVEARELEALTAAPIDPDESDDISDDIS